jgi:hypothetical protein
VAIFAAGADPGPATFNPASGAPVPCQVDIRHDVQLQGDQSQVWRLGSVLEYLIAETGRVVLVGESFTVGATTWTVQEIVSNDNRFSKVIVK